MWASPWVPSWTHQSLETLSAIFSGKKRRDKKTPHTFAWKSALHALFRTALKQQPGSSALVMMATLGRFSGGSRLLPLQPGRLTSREFS